MVVTSTGCISDIDLTLYISERTVFESLFKVMCIFKAYLGRSENKLEPKIKL